MPAISLELLKQNVKNKMILKGFTKKEYDSDGNVVDTGRLTNEMEKIIDAICEGIQETWEVWQVSQIVIGNDTITGNPITGKLP